MTRAGLRIETDIQSDKTVIVRLCGSHKPVDDLKVVRERLEALLAQGHDEFILDLGEVGYLDSAGLGEIVRLFTLISRHGGRMQVGNPPKRIKELLTVTRWFDRFRLGREDAAPELNPWSPKLPDPGSQVQIVVASGVLLLIALIILLR